MKRRTRQLLTLGLLATVATVLVSWPAVLKFTIQEGLHLARGQGTNLSWNGLTTGMSTARLETLTIWIPGPRVKGTFAIPISIELQQISLAFKLASILTLSPTATYSTQLYGGSISGEAKSGRGGPSFSAEARGLELGKHPQLASLGVKGGSTTGIFQDIRITQQGIEGGNFSLRIRELAPPTLEAVRTLLRTNNLGTVDFDADGTISDSKVDVTSIRLSSIFGSVEGNLSASDHLSPAPKLKGAFDVSLSENGMATLGPWLQLIPNGGLDATTTAFTVTATSVPCSLSRSSGTVIRLSSGCLTLAFVRR